MVEMKAPNSEYTHMLVLKSPRQLLHFQLHTTWEMSLSKLDCTHRTLTHATMPAIISTIHTGSQNAHFCDSTY